MIQKQEFYQLLDKYIAGKCTPEETAFIESWYETYEEQHNKHDSLPDYENDLDEVWNNLGKILRKKKIIIWPWISAAASILLFLCIGIYYKNRQHLLKPQFTQIIMPGGNKAILTLSNGKQILLTNAQNGKLANQGNTIISKTSKGQIVYTSITANKSTFFQPVLYNTMTIPRGGQYLLVLPDGSKVWLNSSSSLRYPTAFSGKERRVELTGEAYFEIIHNAASPFRVVTKGQVVEDIGTQFNIKAYDDEELIKTTLIEGSIKVAAKNQQMMLKPGQQLTLNTQTDNKSIQLIDNANVEEAIAWKNGYFRFNNEKIPEIMRQLSRWYDIDVIYKGNITNEGLNGKISRYKNISQIIEMLESTKLVHFKVQGREVTVIE